LRSIEKEKIMLKRIVTIAGLGSAALLLFLVPTQGGQDQRLYPADRPSINELRQDGTTLIVGWDGHENFKHYNLHRSFPGGTPVRKEVGSGIQRSIRTAPTCRSGFVWREARPQDFICVTPETRAQTAEDNRLAASRRDPNGGPYGPNTCRQGFVWREAFPDDLVCVTPETRAQAAEDNRLAASRRTQ
jgi:hypothetical protein